MLRVSSVIDVSGLATSRTAMDPIYRIRGTAIHAANEALAEGAVPVVPDEWQGYVVGLQKWYAQFNPTVPLGVVERRIVSRVHQVTGRLDMVPLIDRQPVVVDVKTGGAAQWHGIQTAGYHMLAVEDERLWALLGLAPVLWTERHAAYQRAILYLPGDGTYRWTPQRDPQHDYLWRAALALANYRREHGLLFLDDPENPDDTPAVILDEVPF